ncbi:MAG: glycosyltransferase family 8 protein [Lachnospiraceae bacterium]|nr:glycosyltransferase family 8 protein [Lachnospiraceae bacterium]
MINVLYQFDDNYAPYAGVSILSLLEHNKGEELTVYCAAMDVSAHNTERINEQIVRYGQKVIWIDTSYAVEMIESLNVGKWNGSYATWIKMFVIHRLEDDIDRLLYLDCDTIVEGNLSGINSIDLGACPLACAYDSVSQNIAGKIGTEAYYNAGVILFNVRKWKEEGFFEKMFEHLKANVNSYPDNEQRLINDYFRSRIMLLPVNYNMQCTHLAYSDGSYFAVYKKKPYYSPKEIEEARKNPVVYHFFRFLGDYPWEENNLHPMRDMYFHWKERSLWSDDLLKKNHKSSIFTIEKTLYRILPQRVFLRIFKLVHEHVE